MQMKCAARKAAAGFAAFLILFSVVDIHALAAVKKISKVKIAFEVEGHDSEGVPVMTATTNGKSYSVVDVYHESSTQEKKEEVDDGFDLYREPEQVKTEKVIDYLYVVELEADDNYIFAVSKKTDVSLSGGGAEYVKAAKSNQNKTLLLHVRFTKIDSFLGPVSGAQLGADGRASWEAAQNALNYEMRYIVNGTKKGAKLFTAGTSYDMSPLMQEQGSYSLQIRPLSVQGKPGDWIETNSVSVSPETAQKNRALYEVQKELIYADEQNKTPDSATVRYLNMGWQTAADGKLWYKNQDGTYPQLDWLLIDGAWYFFDAQGYMIKDQQLSWGPDLYRFGEDGKMLEEKATEPLK